MLLFALLLIALCFYGINDTYNKAARTPGTKIYEANKRFKK